MLIALLEKTNCSRVSLFFILFCLFPPSRREGGAGGMGTKIITERSLPTLTNSFLKSIPAFHFSATNITRIFISYHAALRLLIFLPASSSTVLTNPPSPGSQPGRAGSGAASLHRRSSRNNPGRFRASVKSHKVILPEP